MGGTKQSLGAFKERSASEIPDTEIPPGMTKLQFCLLAPELMGLGNVLYPNNPRLVEEWDLSLNHLTLGEVTEIFKRLFIPQISPSHQS